MLTPNHNQIFIRGFDTKSNWPESEELSIEKWSLQNFFTQLTKTHQFANASFHQYETSPERQKFCRTDRFGKVTFELGDAFVEVTSFRGLNRSASSDEVTHRRSEMPKCRLLRSDAYSLNFTVTTLNESLRIIWVTFVCEVDSKRLSLTQRVKLAYKVGSAAFRKNSLRASPAFYKITRKKTNSKCSIISEIISWTSLN